MSADATDSFEKDVLFALNRQVTPRAANSMINAAYAPELFWDGRASGTFIDPQTGATVVSVGGALESQAVGPIVSDVEMAHADRDWDEVASKLRRAQDAIGNARPYATRMRATLEEVSKTPLDETHPLLAVHPDWSLAREGTALDLKESSPVDGFDLVIAGTDRFDETADSDVVVLTAGIPRRPGMSRNDLLTMNAALVSDLCAQIGKTSPHAVVIVVTNPVVGS